MISCRRILSTLVVIVCTAVSSSAQKEISSHQYPPPLTEVGECTGKLPLQPDVLKVVLNTDVAHEDIRNGVQAKDFSKLFEASRIWLGHNRQAGLLVCGKGEMTGADNNWYWVVATPYTHPRVVLYEGSDGLTFLKSVHHGYRDIESGWAVAAQSHDKIFHFDGDKYILARERCYVPSELKMKRIKCY